MTIPKDADFPLQSYAHFLHRNVRYVLRSVVSSSSSSWPCALEQELNALASMETNLGTSRAIKFWSFSALKPEIHLCSASQSHSESREISLPVCFEFCNSPVFIFRVPSSIMISELLDTFDLW